MAGSSCAQTTTIISASRCAHPLARLLAFWMRLLLHFSARVAGRARRRALRRRRVALVIARDVAAFSARLGAFRSCLGLASSAAPVYEMLHGEASLMVGGANRRLRGERE